MRRATHRQTTRVGYTLLELMLVLVVGGIVTAIALPRLDLTRYRSDAEAQFIRTLLQQAQRAAIVQQHDVLVSVDTSGGRVRLAWDGNNDGVISSGERSTWHSLETGTRFTAPSVGIDGSATSTVAGTGLRTVDGYPTIVFHRDGSTGGDATIYVETTAHRRAFRAVSVIQSTGRTDWYRQASSGAWARGGL